MLREMDCMADRASVTEDYSGGGEGHLTYIQVHLIKRLTRATGMTTGRPGFSQNPLSRERFVFYRRKGMLVELYGYIFIQKESKKGQNG